MACRSAISMTGIDAERAKMSASVLG